MSGGATRPLHVVLTERPELATPASPYVGSAVRAALLESA